jgi:hypothetical protein
MNSTPLSRSNIYRRCFEHIRTSNTSIKFVFLLPLLCTLCLTYCFIMFLNLPNLPSFFVWSCLENAKSAVFWNFLRSLSSSPPINSYSKSLRMYFLYIVGLICLMNKNISLFSLSCSRYSFKVNSFIWDYCWSLAWSILSTGCDLFRDEAWDLRDCRYSLSCSLDLSITTFWDCSEYWSCKNLALTSLEIKESGLYVFIN